MRSPIAHQDAASTAESTGAGLLRFRRVSVVVGALDETLRREMREGKRPRIDVVEMESRFGAQVYDFSRLQQQAKTDRRAGLILRFVPWAP